MKFFKSLLELVPITAFVGIGGLPGARDDAVEKRARAFAPAFLAPPDEVRHWFRSGGGELPEHGARETQTAAGGG